jgi:hypothetical protein
LTAHDGEITTRWQARPGVAAAAAIIHQSHFHHHQDKLDLYPAMQHHSPVSSILLQENRFSPLSERAFFCPMMYHPGNFTASLPT